MREYLGSGPSISEPMRSGAEFQVSTQLFLTIEPFQITREHIVYSVWIVEEQTALGMMNASMGRRTRHEAPSSVVIPFVKSHGHRLDDHSLEVLNGHLIKRQATHPEERESIQRYRALAGF